jgi:hypothetical protein
MRDSTEINKTGEGPSKSSSGPGGPLPDFDTSLLRGPLYRAGNFVPAALLVSCCLILYLPSIMYFFAQDDFFFLHRAVTIGLDDPIAALRPAGPFLRPLSTTLYFAGMLKLFGLRPEAYHVVSLAIFCATTLLVFRLGNIIFRDRAAGFATALFYLGRGVHFETVSWVSGIQDLLMIFFMLASLVLYLGAGRDQGPGFDGPEPERGGPGRLVLSLVLYIGALLSKETAVVFPFILLAAEILVLRSKSYRRSLMAALPFFAMSAAFVLVRFMLVPSMPGQGKYATGLGLFWLPNLARYFFASINPFLIPSASFPSNFLRLLLCLAALVGVIAVALSISGRGRRAGTEVGEKRRLAGFGMVFFALGIMPALQFVDRFEPYYASLAAVGTSITLAAILFLFPNRRLRAAVLAAVFAFSIAINIHLRTERLSHVGRFSEIAELAISEFRPELENAPPGTIVYVSRSHPYISAALYDDKALKAFFPAVESVIFDHETPDYQPDGTEMVFRSEGGRFIFVK